ncbi:unnamed protein product [Adineta steineri]|uniref:Cystatin domain-containing protein n=1 Tax=Adineta steineri TaxID=433720 RepID=A0A814Z233_9BILA|nr:unnamed protein product [Adineta steineri]CAF1237095.1 unnamed protein product [Adineta steineri]
MFKVAAVFFMLLVACHGLFSKAGSYQERPDLIEDKSVLLLTHFAAGYLHTSQNLLLQDYRVIRVQTQLVNGMNYKIDFVAKPVNDISGEKTTCQVVIHVSFQSVKSILQTQCQTS